MAREYGKEYAADFLKKAERFFDISKELIEEYPAEAAFNAVQAIINANDALTVWALQKRASADHREAIMLHKEAAAKTGESKVDTLHDALALREATGYDVKKPASKDECRLLVVKAGRFISWVKNLIA